MSSLKVDALKLRTRGLSVFPVSNETKTPLVKWNRLQDALPTEAEVNEWFTPNNRSIGVATGPVSDIFLLDFDFSKHPESKAWHEANKHRIPRTWTERTKSGGLHYYFRWSPALAAKQTNTTGDICAGVDTKGYGGYSKISPSEGYTWINPPQTTILAACPEWLLALLPSRDSFKQIKPLEQRIFNIAEGNRDHSFTSIAGSLRDKGFKPEAIFELLRAKAKEVEFADADLWRICQSVGRYAPSVTEPVQEGMADSIEKFLEDTETVEWICEPFIAKKSIGFVAGLPETGKTWILIDLAIEMAKGGGLWLGKFPVKGGKVLFIDQERFKGETQRRFRSVVSAKTLDLANIKNSLYIRCGTTTRLDLQHSFDAFRRELTEIRPDIVVVDSFATFHTKEENNRKEIQEVLERVKQIRTEFGCTFIFIDHENKMVFQDQDQEVQPNAFRMAGSIAKPAAAEFVLTVRKQEGSTFVYHTKSTLASTAAPFMVAVKDLNPEKTQIKVEAY